MCCEAMFRLYNVTAGADCWKVIVHLLSSGKVAVRWLTEPVLCPLYIQSVGAFVFWLSAVCHLHSMW